MADVSAKPVVRVRRSGALLVAAVIALIGAVPLASAAGWALSPILLIPLIFLVWAWRTGTDVFTDRLKVRALIGSTEIPWSRVAELAPDPRGRVSALLDNGNVLRLTGVTRANLPTVLAATGQQVSSPPPPD
jgi:hypothetical protein